MELWECRAWKKGFSVSVCVPGCSSPPLLREPCFFGKSVGTPGFLHSPGPTPGMTPILPELSAASPTPLFFPLSIPMLLGRGWRVPRAQGETIPWTRTLEHLVWTTGRGAGGTREAEGPVGPPGRTSLPALTQSLGCGCLCPCPSPPQICRPPEDRVPSLTHFCGSRTRNQKGTQEDSCGPMVLLPLCGSCSSN